MQYVLARDCDAVQENESKLEVQKQQYTMKMLRNIMKAYIVATMDYCRNLQCE